MKSQPQRVMSGRSIILTFEEELEIVNVVKVRAKCELPVDRRDIFTIQAIVQNYMRTVGRDRPNPFANDLPGIDWLHDFEKRHPDWSHRKSEILTTARGKRLSSEVMKIFFDKYEKLLDDDMKDRQECIYAFLIWMKIDLIRIFELGRYTRRHLPQTSNKNRRLLVNLLSQSYFGYRLRTCFFLHFQCIKSFTSI